MLAVPDDDIFVGLILDTDDGEQFVAGDTAGGQIRHRIRQVWDRISGNY